MSTDTILGQSIRCPQDAVSIHLFQLTRQGRIDELRQLLTEYRKQFKGCVNMRDNNKLTALQYAARNAQLGIVKLLVEEAGADVNAATDNGRTPLHFATYNRRKMDENHHGSRLEDLSPSSSAEVQPQEQLAQRQSSTDQNQLPGNAIPREPSSNLDSIPVDQVINYLVQRGAHLNGADICGRTALHYAAINGNEIATRQLLKEQEINKEAVDHELLRPIHLAAYHGMLNIVAQLLSHGADFNAKCRKGCIPLHYACASGRLELVELLLDETRIPELKDSMPLYVNTKNCNEETPLHWACASGQVEVVRVCIDKGADPNLVSTTGETCLHVAARHGCPEIVELLLQNGVRFDQKDCILQCALHKAAERDHIDVLRLLIRDDPDRSCMESLDGESNTPLMLAVKHGRTRAVNFLLEQRADVFAVDKNNKSLVHLCAEANRVDLLEEILRHDGARSLIDMPTIFDDTPLHVAAKFGHYKIVKLLVEHGAIISVVDENARKPLHIAAENGRVRIARYLLGKQPAQISDSDQEGNTPMHLAASQGHRAMLEVLLDAKSDVGFRNHLGLSALDCAIVNGHFDCVEFLLRKHSPLHSVDNSRMTPIHLACRYGHPEIVELLLHWGADPTARCFMDYDHRGFNSLDMAIAYDQKSCARVLLQSTCWAQVLRNRTHHRDGTIDTPMRKLIRFMPDLAELVLDQCRSKHDSTNQHEYNFEFIDDDSYADWSAACDGGGSRDELRNFGQVQPDACMENVVVITPARSSPPGKKRSGSKMNHPLMCMVEFNRDKLLQHQVVGQLLKQKWARAGLFYGMNLAIYLVYVIAFSVYLCRVLPDQFNRTTSASSSNFTSKPTFRTPSWIQHNDVVSTLLMCTLCFVAVVSLLKEFYQLCLNGLRYITIENVTACTVFTLGLLFAIDFDTYPYQQVSPKRDWQWQCGSFGVFLTWLYLLLFLRPIPVLGIYVLMFAVIMRTFAKFFFVLLLFIIAFAFGFYALLPNHTAFHSMGNSLLKTSVMMLGEMEFDTTFNEQYETANPSNTIHYNEVTYLLFVVFLVVMTIVVVNLLVGLAVDDIQGVQEEAVVTRLALQIEQLLDIESLLPAWLIKCWNTANKSTRRETTPKCIIEFNHKASKQLKRMWGQKLQRTDDTEDNKGLHFMIDQLETMKRENSEMLRRQRHIDSVLCVMARLLSRRRSRTIGSGDEQHSSVESLLDSLN